MDTCEAFFYSTDSVVVFVILVALLKSLVSIVTLVSALTRFSKQLDVVVRSF